MKKIGILFGQENSFPWAFIDRVNQKTGGERIVAEAVRIDKVIQGESCGYDVIIDRISQDVPFYRAFLKNAALTGTAVVNNPFWWSADEKFFNNALATKVGVAVPRTVLQIRTRTRFGTWPIRSIGKGSSITWAGRHSSNPSPAAAGKTCIASTTRKNFIALTAKPGSW
jgi:hypothetical protein